MDKSVILKELKNISDVYFEKKDYISSGQINRAMDIIEDFNGEPKEVVEEKDENLNTHVLPKYNCSNCSHFKCKGEKYLFETRDNDFYAFECDNVTHPLLDCVLRGFQAHSEQPSFSQTLNK